MIYSSVDSALRAELATHLTLLQRQGLLDVWYDRKMDPGDEWDPEIRAQLEAVEIVLLLVSADFMASDYVWDVELKRVMERQAAGEVRVIPVLIRPCYWKSASFAKLAALPGNGRPVVDWKTNDHGWLEVVRGLRTVLEKTPTLAPPASAPSRRSPAITRGTASPFVVGRPIERDEDFFGRERQKRLLEDALRQGQSVEILGERRMGKSSMLRWVARHAGRFQDRPVVLLDAQAAAIQSPVGLVRAAARELRREEAVDAVLTRSASEGESRAAAMAVEALGSAVLLVDEAEGLVRRSQGFDDGVLDALRAAGQAGRLVWVSVAVERLRDRFQADGLTSSFLNDSRLVVVGQLSEGEARALLRRGLDGEAVEEVWRLAAGFAYGLQSLGDAVWRSPEAVERALDLAASDLEPFLSGWWNRQSETDHGLLQRSLDGLEVNDLGDGERRKTRALDERGLLMEAGGKFQVIGVLWAEMVRRGG